MKKIKSLFAEFKAFITRGNIIDMAVGVIIASAFSAIVTALTDNIIMPLINAAVGGEGTEGLRTVLKGVYTLDANGTLALDLENSIYVDWGVFIRAIMDFIIIALVLFILVKIVASVRKATVSLKSGAHSERVISKRAKQIKKEENITQSEARKKAIAALDAEAKAKAEEEAAAKAAMPVKLSTDEILMQIRDLLAESNKKAEPEDGQTTENV